MGVRDGGKIEDVEKLWKSKFPNVILPTPPINNRYEISGDEATVKDYIIKLIS
jgi:hypothetical protein